MNHFLVVAEPLVHEFPKIFRLAQKYMWLNHQRKRRGGTTIFLEPIAYLRRVLQCDRQDWHSWIFVRVMTIDYLEHLKRMRIQECVLLFVGPHIRVVQ